MQNWTRTHFLCYLYIVIAHADFNISKDEMKKITARLKKKLQDDMLVEEVFEEVFDVFESQNDAAVSDFILHQAARFCGNAADVDNIMQNLKELALADDVQSAEETGMLLQVKKILQSVC